MERSGNQLVQTHESFRSFDVLASVDLFRYDLLTVGYILPETQQRVIDEELSYIAEGIDRPLQTTFTLREVGGELAYFDRGKWQSYLSTLIRGLEIAELEAAVDPRKTFMVERASKDLVIGYKLEQLQVGQKLKWYSPFAEKECALYGSKFVGELGFQAARRMGFVYLAERNIDGSLTLSSQSVDNSDEEAFVAAMQAAANKNDDISTMRAVYDQVLSQKYGGSFYAGRRPDSHVPEENAWLIIAKHKDLFNFYFSEIEVLARQNNQSRTGLEYAKKRLTYGVWGALKERLDRNVLPKQNAEYDNPLVPWHEAMIRQEIGEAYQTLSRRGEVLFGCGGAIAGEAAILNASGKEVFDSVFDGKSEWKKMTCPFCGDKNQWGDPCSSNQHCKACDARVVAGKVSSKGKSGKTKALMTAR